MNFRMHQVQLEEIKDWAKADKAISAEMAAMLIEEVVVCHNHLDLLDRQNALNADLIKAVASDNRTWREAAEQEKAKSNRLAERMATDLQTVKALLAEADRENRNLREALDRSQCASDPDEGLGPEVPEQTE